MIDHLSTYATDFDRSAAFYEVVMDVLGYSVQKSLEFPEDPDLPGRRSRAWGPEFRPIFWVIEVKAAYTPRHIALTAPDRATVDRFYAAGLAAGGRDHGEPGVRAIYHPNYYGGFLLDPDDNNLEAVCHFPG